MKVELSEIRLGDTVRLRNGEQIVVTSKTTSYTDRAGEHFGPFVGGENLSDRFHLGDVVEVVACNARACVFCGEGVTSTEPDVDYCRGCLYLGRGWERRLEPLIGRLNEVPAVEGVAVWHTGGGCFNLAVRLAGGRLLTPSVGVMDEAGDGRVWPEPGFPEEPGEKWAMVVAESEEAWSEWDEDRLYIPQSLYTEDELVAAVADIAKEGVPS